jgi:hypothetical protein
MDWFDGNNVFHAENTLVPGVLPADSSVWVGDTGLTPFVISLTINTGYVQTIPINIFASPEYDATGYFYIDPVPTVSAS